MIKKLVLLLTLGFASQMSLEAYSKRYDARENFEGILKVSAGVACITGLICLVIMYPKQFGDFAGALLTALADRRYCFHCDCYHYGRHNHVQVTTYTTIY